MENKKSRSVLTASLCLLWLGLAAWAWLRPADALSVSERRPLKQFPEATAQSLLDGKFVTDFESYTLDQFPLRDTFRQLKALFHYNVLQQKDNNGIYLHDGYAAQLEYPLKEESLDHALKVFQRVYDKYLKESGSKVHLALIPDKGYYLGDVAGVPLMDYEKLTEKMQQGMPYASYVNLFDSLSLDAYYRTDTHWRQEKLLPAATALCQALGIPVPSQNDYQTATAENPFFGVYYGQAALPMEGEPISWLENKMLQNCIVTNFESGVTGKVYDLQKLQGMDLYEVFLSGPVSLLTIENPAVNNGKELILFRDSFGSAMAPLLVQGYEKITLVDIRYLSSNLLNRFIDFHGQDVLFLYSTLVLNNSSTIK